LKDYASTPQYRGIGVPIVCFAIGLISAIFSYITLSFAQMGAKNSVLDKVKHNPSMLVFWAHYSGLLISILSFIVAIFTIVYRAMSL